MIVAIGGEKGGVGKTTLALHLAYLLTKGRQDTLLVDADPQGTASIFCAARDQNDGQPRIQTVMKTGAGVARSVRDLAAKFEHIVIDTGGRDTAELRQAMLVADQVVLPINPTAFNWWTLERMDELVGEIRLQNEALQAFVLLNNVPSNWTLTQQVVSTAIEKIEASGFKHLGRLQAFLINRSIYGMNEEVGRTVFEARLKDGKTDEKAQGEMITVFREIVGDDNAAQLGTAA
jgi:chromosome partitioning protein